MPSDEKAVDVGLLSPVTVGHDAGVSDAAFLDALVTVEVGLSRAVKVALWGSPDGSDAPASKEFGWSGPGELVSGHGVDLAALAAASVSGGNPVIPLVKLLRQRAKPVHEGATSQDIIDSAMMLLASRARRTLLEGLSSLEDALIAFAAEHRDHVTVARTLTQHGVPTTVGLRAANWLRGVRRAHRALTDLTLPAQLGGAGGTLAASAEHQRVSPVARLPHALADELALDAPDAPWHTNRWPITELGDALVQVLDALGKIATDVATLSRTEIAELAEGEGGGSSAMPQKQNPVGSVLLRSAALRAPQLGATLHLASALAADERPDGAWHAEWPTLRELLRLALGAVAHAGRLVAGLQVDRDAVAQNLGLTRGLIMAERVSATFGPDAAEIIRRAQAGENLRDLVREHAMSLSVGDGRKLYPLDDEDSFLDPSTYLGLARQLVDAALKDVPLDTAVPEPPPLYGHGRGET